MLLEDVEQAFAGDLPELGGQVDDRVHHREGRGRGPQERRAEAGAGAGVSANRDGVVIARSGDDAETERPEHPLLAITRRVGRVGPKVPGWDRMAEKRQFGWRGSTARGGCDAYWPQGDDQVRSYRVKAPRGR